MTYQESLRAAEKVGASKAEDLPLLAMTIASLAMAHAINPQLVYDGAVKQRLTAADVRKLSPVNLANLMFD